MKEYTVKSIRKWGTDNIYSVTFEEENGEPTDWFEPEVVPAVGEKVKGKLEEYRTNSGGVRRRFVTKVAQEKEDTRQLEINTSWAITNALNIALDYDKQTIKTCAEMLLEIKKELMDE